MRGRGTRGGRTSEPARRLDAARLRAAAGPDLEACKLSATPEAYLVIDSNVALHQARAASVRSACTVPHVGLSLLRLPLTAPRPAPQLDFLEHPRVNDVIVPGVVLEEARRRRRSAPCVTARSSRL